MTGRRGIGERLDALQRPETLESCNKKVDRGERLELPELRNKLERLDRGERFERGGMPQWLKRLEKLDREKLADGLNR